MNGHVGMNEPGSPENSRARVTEIAPLTQQVGQKYFSNRQPPDKGLTLGMADILESSHVFLLVNGSKKASIIQQVMEGEISENLPASLLRRHTSLEIYLDKEAASGLHSI